jgi:hypothetical protein
VRPASPIRTSRRAFDPLPRARHAPGAVDTLIAGLAEFVSATDRRAALLAQVEGWLRAETGQRPQLKSLLSAGYEALRPCLPPQ